MSRPACLFIILLLSGCALKQYPQSLKVSDDEAKNDDCATLQHEVAVTHDVQQQIAKTGQFDALTVIGFVGDFGIGNGIAKASADQKARARLQQLEALEAVRCHPAA